MVQVDTYYDNVNRILEAETFLIARAAKKIYQKIGGGREENVYREALQKEFERRRIKYKKACPDIDLNSLQSFRPDFLCFGNLVLYTISAETIRAEERRLLKECLQKLDFPLGLIVNFGAGNLSMERVSI